MSISHDRYDLKIVSTKGVIAGQDDTIGEKKEMKWLRNHQQISKTEFEAGIGHQITLENYPTPVGPPVISQTFNISRDVMPLSDRAEEQFAILRTIKTVTYFVRQLQGGMYV